MLSELLQVAQISASLTIIGGIIFAAVNLQLVLRTMRNARYAQIMNSEFQHNKMIFESKYQQAAVSVMLGLHTESDLTMVKALEAEPNGSISLYWATRAIHINQLNLLLQIWRMCDESFTKVNLLFPEWHELAVLEARELFRRENDAGRPDWYVQGCKSIGSDNFGKTFMLQINMLN